MVAGTVGAGIGTPVAQLQFVVYSGVKGQAKASKTPQSPANSKRLQEKLLPFRFTIPLAFDTLQFNGPQTLQDG